MIEKDNTQAATAGAQQPPTSQAPQAASPPQAPSAPAPEQSLESLLDQFTRETSQPAQQRAATPASQQPDNAPAANDPAALAKVHEAHLQAMQSGMATDSLRQQLGIVTESLRATQNYQRSLQDRADFDKFVSDADRMLKDAGVAVGAEFSRRFLMSEAMANPQLREAFDTRFNSKDHLRRFERIAEKMEQKLLRAARAEPDQQATADRAAVAAAVRATSSKIPEKGPVRYGDMDDATFAKEKAKWGV